MCVSLSLSRSCVTEEDLAPRGKRRVSNSTLALPSRDCENPRLLRNWNGDLPFLSSKGYITSSYFKYSWEGLKKKSPGWHQCSEMELLVSGGLLGSLSCVLPQICSEKYKPSSGNVSWNDENTSQSGAGSRGSWVATSSCPQNRVSLLAGHWFGLKDIYS